VALWGVPGGRPGARLNDAADQVNAA